MTVPLLRVCVYCGYPMPGSHASSCRDVGGVVAEVAYTANVAATETPTYPARLAQDYELDRIRAELASLTAEVERLRKELDDAELLMSACTWGQVLGLKPPVLRAYRVMRPVWTSLWPISRAIRRNQAGTRLWR